MDLAPPHGSVLDLRFPPFPNQPLLPIPFVRGRSQPFPPPVGRNYPQHSFSSGRQALSSSTKPTSFTKLTSSVQPALSTKKQVSFLPSPSYTQPAGRHVYNENHSNLVRPGLLVEDEQRMYFDVTLWKWRPKPAGFELETPVGGELRGGQEQALRPQKKGGVFKRLRAIFTRRASRSGEGNRGKDNGDQRYNLKSKISKPFAVGHL